MPRTDTDTWDLASSVGATATMVAAARALATKAATPLIKDQFAEPLVRAVGVEFFTRWVSGDLVAADVDEGESGWRLEHMPTTMAARTRFFDTFVQDAIWAGIRQAVILASGLDTRAYRLAWPPDMTVFEIDQPQVLAFKSAQVAKLGATSKADLRTVAVDLRQNWPKALIEAGLDTSQPTAWTAEGLFDYLPPVAQDLLLDNVTVLSAPGSRLASEALPDMSPQESQRFEDMIRRATARWRHHGLELELADLGYRGDRNNVASYLEKLGWETVGATMSQLLAANGLARIPHNPDSVSLADNIYYTSVLRR
ncbi:methyltransferase, TIGR00027 family [Mycobacterium parascrofulaceum ATCC BAA-614]|uniref:S-adenosyl-L-methionine-dependent methyltransferase n=1 Tax=Mycobacterium parascrofulaceum ATCC BAA-614 TaxID=525368 RepID=D5P627_9MYCO|nr:class I SAM-dependent methyltransferase [Mycobacterium parascrofulaceum]EFG78463.1 methyltransferase, TIGR00027 family [Mycobacterium parascrofulaceum ATCC BAA-614]